MKMKTFVCLALLALVFSLSVPTQLAAQTVTLTSTTTSAAILAADKSVCLTSATGVTVPGAGISGSQLFLSDNGFSGETLNVRSVTTASASCFNVIRSNRPTSHSSGVTVYIGRGDQFYAYAPAGSCVVASMDVRPWINVLTGNVWDCVNSTWSPINDGPLVTSCGTAAAGSAAVCAGSTIKAASKMVVGTSALLSASPSAVTITAMPAFTSATSYTCTLTPTGATAAIAAGGLAFTGVSATSFTVTGPNTVTTPFSYLCVGN